MPSGSTPLPPIKVQIGFASNPLDVPQTWTDITDLVRTIKIDRGRQHVLNRFEPGRLTLTCNGRGRELDPFNTSSAYYPNLKINKQIQVLVQWASTWYPLFTGFVDAYTPLWLDNLNTDLEITATDGLRILQAQTITGLTGPPGASVPGGPPPPGGIWPGVPPPPGGGGGGGGGVGFLGSGAPGGPVSLVQPATSATNTPIATIAPGSSAYILVGVSLSLVWHAAPATLGTLFSASVQPVFTNATVIPGFVNAVTLGSDGGAMEQLAEIVVLLAPTGGTIDLGVNIAVTNSGGAITWSLAAYLGNWWAVGF